MNRPSERRRAEGGFSLVEAMIMVAVIVPILGGIAMTTASVNDTMEANSRSADVTTYARRMMVRTAKLVRPAQMSTLRTPAVEQDVVELRADKVGDWVQPSDLIWHAGIEFRSASGLLSMNAALSTSLRRALFVLDPKETVNGKDDDHDGLIDEGNIVLLQNGVTLDILRDVEELRFALEGRMMKIRMRVARRGTDGRVYRATTETHFYIRNN